MHAGGPSGGEPSAEIRYLTQSELVVLERGVPDGPLQVLGRALYVIAATTGLRQGELLGLRWMDVDAGARKVRVRRAYVRGEFKAPKSVRGARGVPLAAEIGMALESLRAQSAHAFEGDLVFGQPQTGEPLDRAYVRKRFQRACRRAGVRTIRFHDLRHTSGTRVAALG